MIRRVAADYGMPETGWVNETVVRNPLSQKAAEFFSKGDVDKAQLSMCAVRAIVHFPTSAGDPTATYALTMWGEGSDYYPTIVRSAAGLYVVTFPLTFQNELLEEETLEFKSCKPHINSVTVFGDVQAVVVGGNIINVQCQSTAHANSDLTVGTSIALWIV